MVRSLLRSLYTGPLAARLRRFVVVGTIAASVQTVLLWTFVEYGGLNYLLGAFVSIEVTIVLQYVINDAWTFRSMQNTGLGYFVGLLKTNVVRGSAIPIQLSVLYALVSWYGVLYLLANAAAIAISGVYRYVLDARWTWGRS